MALRAKKTLFRGRGQMFHVANFGYLFGGFTIVQQWVFNVGIVLGSQGSPDRSLEGFWKSSGEISNAPGGLWGMFWTPLGIES